MPTFERRGGKLVNIDARVIEKPARKELNIHMLGMNYDHKDVASHFVDAIEVALRFPKAHVRPWPDLAEELGQIWDEMEFKLSQHRLRGVVSHFDAALLNYVNAIRRWANGNRHEPLPFLIRGILNDHKVSS